MPELDYPEHLPLSEIPAEDREAWVEHLITKYPFLESELRATLAEIEEA